MIGEAGSLKYQDQLFVKLVDVIKLREKPSIITHIAVNIKATLVKLTRIRGNKNSN